MNKFKTTENRNNIYFDETIKVLSNFIFVRIYNIIILIYTEKSKLNNNEIGRNL